MDLLDQIESFWSEMNIAGTQVPSKDKERTEKKFFFFYLKKGQNFPYLKVFI